MGSEVGMNLGGGAGPSSTQGENGLGRDLECEESEDYQWTVGLEWWGII